MCTCKNDRNVYQAYSKGLGNIDDIFAKYGIQKPIIKETKKQVFEPIEEVEPIVPPAPSLDISEVMQGDCFSVLLELEKIHVDTKRFQNRLGSFSEISANAVFQSLDPIVVWLDKADNKIYVLSGHSRFEGLKRRKEAFAPVRFFHGTEKEAIRYGKVLANRAADAEGLISDLRAFKLMRDEEKATKSELRKRFRNYAQLENWTYLNPNGEFIGLLKQPNKSAYPHIEKTALWVGELRKENPQMTTQHEKDCFYFFYGGHNYNIDKDSFFKIVRAKLAKNQARLFPECNYDGCVDSESLNQDRQTKELNDQISEKRKLLKDIEKRFKSQNLVYTVEAEQEKTRLQKLKTDIENDIRRLENNILRIQNQHNIF